MNRDQDILMTMRIQGMPAIDIEYTAKRFAAMPAVVPESAPESFVDYMVRNYPPRTIIIDAKWHAKRIWSAASYAILSATDTEVKG